MKYYSAFFCFYLFLGTGLYSQTSAELIPVLEKIQNEIKEVEGKSDTYTQEFTWDETNPCKVKFALSITSKKGKTEELVYEFSLRDIDKNTIKVKNSKDFMMVPIFMDDRQKMIKVFKDGKQEKYTDKLEIAALDVDNARSLETLFEEAVPIADKIVMTNLPESFEERIDWLQQNIIPLEIGENTYGQSLEQDPDLPLVLHYVLAKEGKKATEDSWHFNLSDLKERAVQMKIKGKEVRVEIETNRKLKFIQLDKEGKESSYTNKLAFFAEEPEQGKMIRTVLRAIIKESQELEKNRFPAFSDKASSLKMLSEKITNLEFKNKTYTQRIAAQCITDLTQDVSDDKGNTTEKRYLFNLADLNENQLDVKVGAKGIFLNIETGKTKLIQSFKDGVLQNYTNKISIPAKDVEQVKWLLHAFPASIEYCQESKTEDRLAAKGDHLVWIQEKIASVKNVQQELSKVDEATCKWQFATTKEGKKESTEEIYEFNLYDLNPKTIDFKIAGKTLEVEIATLHSEKNIKYYKNGVPGDYKNKLHIEMEEVEKARQTMNALKVQIENCKK